MRPAMCYNHSTGAFLLPNHFTVIKGSNMKILIASDIHGSAYWCKKVLDAFKTSGAERLLLLGDLLYHGPRNDLPQGYDPKAVTGMLNGAADKIICVRGNCDAEVDQMVLEFPIMADYAYICIREQRIFATHGHLFSPEQPPKLQTGDILISGHTHITYDKTVGSFRCINPGSVSLPKEGTKHSCMICDDGEFTFVDLEK